MALGVSDFEEVVFVDHAMMTGPSGTFLGHFVPGVVFTVWGFWWLWELVSARAPRAADAPLESSVGLPALKVIAFCVALPLELPNAGWEPMDWVMGWHHISLYMGFAFSGLVDLAARARWVGPRATYLGLATAGLNSAILFMGHGNSPGVEGSAHLLLTLAFLAVALFATLEGFVRDRGFEWFRAGAMLGLGAWLTMTAWILFQSGWAMDDHVRAGHVWLRFSWIMLAVASVTTAASALSAKTRAAQG